MNSLSTLILFFTLLVGPLLPSASAEEKVSSIPPTCYLFSYFVKNGKDGLHLAWSRDGYKWEALNGGASYLAPEPGVSRLMRDPCILQGPDGTFHMVWTDGMNARTIAYASSSDLINWSKQKSIPVMEHEPTTINCWAPELTYDEAKKKFLIYWSSTIPGRFPATDKSAKDFDHRTYATETSDFQTFTPTRLFFDPGINSIDGTLFLHEGKTYLFFKDETLEPVAMKNLRLARGETLEGPFHVDPTPINPPGSWTEGPAVIQIGSDVIVYFDCYREGKYGAFRTRDFKNWEDVSSRLVLPKGIRHGTIFAVSGDVVQKLLRSGQQAPTDGASAQ